MLADILILLAVAAPPTLIRAQARGAVAMMRPPLARFVGQHRTVALLAASMIVLAALVIPMAETSGSAASNATTEAPADCTAPPQTSTSGASFTATETLCRVFFDAGVTNTNHFSVTVSEHHWVA